MSSSNTETEKVKYEPIPEGEYLLRMNRIEEKAIKSGVGTLLSAGFEVINGDHKGRLIFHNFIVEHSNPKAEEIGTDQLDKYLKAVGVSDGLDAINNDRTELENYTELPFKGRVKIQEGNNGYPPVNKVVQFSSRT